jgi:predicted TIM-barrel fold metal-dependent hydrolase
MFVENYKISGLKLYTFDSTPARGWWFDDQKMAYPIWEKCRKLGIKNIGCHKGIPFGQFMARYAHAEDLDAAADDFRDLNFIAYHWRGRTMRSWRHWARRFQAPSRQLYCEIGSTFAATVTNRPLECAHVLGTLLRGLGEDHDVGTDSCLWGNPQWQIEAFRKFQIPDQLVEGYGYRS